MAEAKACEAGVFALTAAGWVLHKRRTFPDRVTAAQWLRRSVSSMASRYPAQKCRGSVVPLTGWLTLEWVLSDYEQKRKAGHPEFCDDHARIAAQAPRGFTALQGQYLAFIYYYTKLNGRPPAEADMQQRFAVTPPVVHDMVVKLEKKGLIARTPGAARSIRVLVPRDQLPDLE